MTRRPPRQPTPPAPGAELLKAGASATQPDVWKLPADRLQPDRVWKTFRESPAPLRATVCRWIAQREGRNLQHLQGLPGVPEFLGFPEPWTVEMTWLSAEPVPETKTGHGLGRDYFDELDRLIRAIHARGLNHGDLRRRNLMRHARTGAPVLVDFAQSLAFPPQRQGWIGRRVFLHAAHVDRLTFLKLKRWYLGETALSAEESEELAAQPASLRFGRLLKKGVYRRYKHWRQGKVRKDKTKL
ncbi:MAG: hypothetical protein RLY93_05880 [Sumerlaeia bacterium]